MRYILQMMFLLLPFVTMAKKFEEADGTGTVKGKVTTEDNKPAANVSIAVQNSKKGTITEDDGSFVINKLKPGNYQLEISLLGYETLMQQVTVTEGATVKVSMQLHVSDRQLQEVRIRSGKSPYVIHKPSASLRLNEPLLETPQNIQIISGKALTDQQIVNMSDGVLRNVSGATRLEHWADLYTNVHMRGSQVSAFRNGMNVVTSSWSPLTEDMSVTDHLEFVKGPAGFMMSVGDPAGIYNVVTKKPTGVTKGEASFMMGSYDMYRATLDLDGKLDSAGKLLYRFNVAGQTKNSFRPFEFSNKYIVAPVISYQLDDKTILTAEYLLQKVKMSDVGSYYMFSTKGYAVLPRDFTTADPGLDPTYVTDQSITLNLQHKFSDKWKLTVQAAYLDYKQKGSDLWPISVSADSMIRGISSWDAASTAKIGQAFVNGEMQTGKVQHRIIVGIDANSKDYMADWNQNYALDNAGAQFVFNSPDYGYPSNGYPSFDRTKSLQQRAGLYAVQKQTYTGLYAQDELGFLDNTLRVTLAGRYSYVQNNDYNSIATAKKITPRVGVSYSIDNQTSVYALFDQALLPQSGTKKDLTSVKPLTGSNMELGVKRDWMAGRLTTTLSAYRILRNNVNSSDPSDPTGRYIIQLGQTLSKGIEFDIRGEIAPNLIVTANYALTDSKITKADSSAASQATIGNKVPGFAKHTANAWLSYTLANGVLKGLGISGGVTFLGQRSSWEWSADADQKNLPDYTKIDGGIFWEHDKMRITLNVFNLADKYLYSGAAYADYYYWQAEPGRNWRLGINYRF